jgi:AAA+ superfamily predicted ATPase
MEEITLEDHLLNSMAADSVNEFGPLLENIEIKFNQIFKRGTDRAQAVQLAKSAIIAYASVYQTVKHKIRITRKDTAPSEDVVLRNYMAYIASEGVLQTLSDSSNTTLVKKTSSARTPSKFNPRYNLSDQSTLSDIIKLYKEHLGGVRTLERLSPDIQSFFEYVSEQTIDNLLAPKCAGYSNQFKDIAVIGKALGKTFRVEGIKRKETGNVVSKGDTRDENVEHRRGLEEVALEPVFRDSIVGNEGGKLLVDTEIPCLMFYDPVEQRNPFRGFMQYLLFKGKKGTGKTMLAKYAMTLANDIAKQNGKPFSLVKLEFEDRFQCGPIDNIRYQLTQISQGNQIYVVFIDEIDTKIPSRKGNGKDDYKKDVIGEFLRFRGNAGYINRNNFVIVATTNKPNDIDPAILDVFDTVEVAGPVTISEKTQVLYNNLLPGIRRGNVIVENWETIGRSLMSHDFTGRDIMMVAGMSESRYRGIAQSIAARCGYNIRASEVEKQLAITFHNDGAAYVTKEPQIMEAIERRAEARNEERISYL